MGVKHGATVVYGTFAKRGSAAAKRLEAIFDEGNGDAVDVDGTRNVRISRHGNAWTGDFVYSIEHGESVTISNGSGYQGPIQIPKTADVDVALAVVLLGLNAAELEDLGFFVATEVF